MVWWSVCPSSGTLPENGAGDHIKEKMNTQDHAARIGRIVEEHETAIGADWLAQLEALTIRQTGGSQEQLRQHCRLFLAAFAAAMRAGTPQDIEQRAWGEVRGLLHDIAAARARAGSTPAETATFVFSLKQPLFARLRGGFAGDVDSLAEASWTVNTLLDKLGLYTIEAFQRTRDQVLSRQQQELLELSTPVIKLWEGVLALPLIGTLDSARTQVVMESLLQKIVETGAMIAIIDITGVPTVDTLVAQHLLKTIAAARLMGADCIISGIRPQIAQTIVHLGVNLEDVTTKATLADAFMIALKKTGSRVTVQNTEQ